MTTQQCLDVIDQFFDLIDSGRIFKSSEPAFFRGIRQDLMSALGSLLVWDRPRLQATRGVAWPYEGLRKRLPLFLEAAGRDGRDSFEKRQAELFLAFLPFPGQWEWMLRVEQQPRRDPEVAAYLLDEQAEILRKIRRKPQNHYKLRHFCQVLRGYGGPGIKGVLRIFSLPYLFVHLGLLEGISRKYVLYVEPPMGVVFRHRWWRYFSRLEDPCLFGVSSEEDMDFLAGQGGIETVPLAHGDFLEDLDRMVFPPEGGKEYDIVFNATYDDMPRKRHELMLELLHHPLLSRARVLFLGRGEQASVQRFYDLVRGHGVGERVTVLANIRRAEVPGHLARCRMGVHLSLYESACRSIYEYFRSDLPCVISSSMGGMRRDIFTSRTGLAVPDDELPRSIAHVMEHLKDYEPRRWFQAHSGSRNSSTKLNEAIRRLFEKWGYEWPRDIVQLGSSGASRYVHASSCEDFKADFQGILESFEQAAHPGLTFSID